MTIKILIILCFLFSLTWLLEAQTEKGLKERLNKPVYNCETISNNCQEFITGYTINQIDSIEKILTVWKEYCGNNEPIGRVKILMAIQQKRYIDSISIGYFLKYITKFESRNRASLDISYKNLYAYNSYFFDYVPLRSDFDNWTKNIAKEFLKKLNPNSTEYLICLLLSEDIRSFSEAIYSEEYCNNYLAKTIVEEWYFKWNNGVTINLTTGLWMPLGNLSKTFKSSPQIGLLVGTNDFDNSMRYDFSIIHTFLVNNNQFELDVENIKKTAIGEAHTNIGILLTREFKLNYKYFIDANLGAGYSMMKSYRVDSSGARIPDDNNSSSYLIETIDLSVGTSIRKTINKYQHIAINIQYHYTPFSLFGKLVNDIGNQNITFELYYRFKF